MKTYYYLLDAARFFAAFWVMNYHYLSLLGLSSDITWYRYGNLGVQLFFIISGFVIVQSLHGKTLREFATNRFIRLFPLFWIICTITYIIPHFIPHASTSNIVQYLLSMTMLADTFNGVAHSSGLIDPSYWTLNVELIFYVAIGLFAYFCSYKNIRYFLFGWLVLSIGAFALHIDQNYFVKLLLVRHASYFVFGGALASIAMKQAQTVYEKYIDWILLCGSSLYSVWINVQAIPAYISPNSLDAHIVTSILVVFFVTIPLLVYCSRFVRNSKLISVLTVLGGVTYPLYLLHQKLGNTMINFLTNRYTIPWNTCAIWFEIVVICVAYIAYIYDKKMRTWLRVVLAVQHASEYVSVPVPTVAL